MPAPVRIAAKPYHFSASELGTWLNCRRQWWWEYVELLAPSQIKEPLVIGSAAHEALELYFKTLQAGKTPDAKVIIATVVKKLKIMADLEMKRGFQSIKVNEVYEKAIAFVRGFLNNYISHWSREDSKFKVLDVECVFKIPLIKNLDIVGKIDGVLEAKDGSIWVLEHKTASRVSGSYIDKIDFSQQVIVYMAAVKHLYGKYPRGIVYDLILKPSIRQDKNATYKEYLDRYVDWFDTKGSEALYREHVVKSHARLDSEITQLIAMGTDIKMCTSDSIHAYPNPQACDMYGLCPFIRMCQGVKTAMLDLRKKETKHEELGTLS